MLIVTLLIITNTGKNPCLSTGEGINKLWFIQTMVHPNNGILLRNKKVQTTDTQNNMMTLNLIMLTERSQTQRLQDYMYMTFRKGKTIEREKRSEVAQGWGKGLTTKGDEGDGTVLHFDFMHLAKCSHSCQKE